MSAWTMLDNRQRSDLTGPGLLNKRKNPLVQNPLKNNVAPRPFAITIHWQPGLFVLLAPIHPPTHAAESPFCVQFAARGPEVPLSSVTLAAASILHPPTTIKTAQPTANLLAHFASASSYINSYPLFRPLDPILSPPSPLRRPTGPGAVA